MKLSFHFLWFYFCLIGLLSFSIQEMPVPLTTLLKEQVIEEHNSSKKEQQEKEFRKKEEEENEPEENEEKDNSEDVEIEEEYSEYSTNLSTFIHHSQDRSSTKKSLLNNDSNSFFSHFLPNFPPFYILFASLKIDC